MKQFKRIFVIVADSLGVGYDEVAHKYNDEGANTFKHLSYSKANFSIPNLEKMGIGNIVELNNVKKTNSPLASFGKMREKSIGKDTLTGHWELMGLELNVSFPSFTEHGFPKELIDKLEQESGYKVIGNVSASGTEILKDLGEEHMRTKAIIVYTSADSVLQIAAHEEIIPIQELYRICEIARKITLDNPKWMVGRIIARPFLGKDKDSFVRTTNRHDYAVKPFSKTVLSSLKENHFDVISVGKISDIFNGEGITASNKIKSNHDGMMKTLEIAKSNFHGLCFVNLVDFDALYGHRRNALGYAEAVEEFDQDLLPLINELDEDDLLIICADHGNDPTHKGTDHTREFVPLLAYHKNNLGNNLGIRTSFADIGATIADNFKIELPYIGTSFLKEV